MVDRAFLQDEYLAGEPGSGLHADALIGNVPDANIPAEITRDSELAAHTADADAHHRPPLDDAQLKKTLEVNAAFTDAGWDASTTAQVSTTIKTGSAPHTASEITGLGYALFRTQPSPNSDPAYIAVRIPLADKPNVAAGKLRITEGERDNPVPYDPAILLTAAQHITDDSSYAYYSVRDADGFVSDDSTWVQELDPFRLNSEYLDASAELNAHDRQVLDSFEEAVWENSTAQLGGPSSTAFNPSVTAIALRNSLTVAAQSLPFFIAVALPLNRKSDASRFRVASDPAPPGGTDEHYGRLSRHIVDGANHAYYEVRFGASPVAQTMHVEELDEHHIDTDNIHINFEELHNTPPAIERGKLVVGNPGGDALEFGELEGADAAVTINGLTIGFDQSQLDILQLGAAQASGVNQAFLTTATGTPRRVVLPGAAYNIDPNNHVVVEWNIDGVRAGRLVYSAILRRLATIAGKTGDEASGDDYHPIDIGWDSSGNRRQLRLYRATDNTLILGGALITSAGALTTEAGASPTRAFQADVYLYEVGGNAGAAARQQQIVSLAPRYWTGYIETAVGTTPNLPIGFDGVSWTGVDAWSRDLLPGSPAAGRTRWFGSATAVYNPAATFDWSIEGATVAPLTDRRFSSVPNARDPSLITSGPTAASLYWNAYEDGAGWSRYWYPLLSNPDWLYLDAVDWRPNAIDSTANIDFPEQDGATLAGLTLWVEVYNSGGHDVFYRVPFNLVPLPNVQAAAAGTVTQTHLNGWEMHWEHRVRSADIFFSDLNLPGGANQANYHKLACNGQLQHRTSPGGTRFNRIALKGPAVYRTNGDILWRFELWARRQ